MIATEKISAEETIDSHIREISDLKIPVRAIIDENIELSDCRLIYEDGEERQLLIQTRLGNYLKQREIEITYSHSKTFYTFKSRIISIKEIDFGYAYLQILFPEAITGSERRKHFRIRPSKVWPIQIQVVLPDKKVVNLEARDISGGGISFVAPQCIGCFEIGALFSMDIAVPKAGKIQATANVRKVDKLLDIVRVGMEFSEISKTAQRIITEYTIRRELETGNVPGRAESFEKARIFIIDDKERHKEYKFLDEKFEVRKVDCINTISKLTAGIPELIVLNLDLPESHIILNIIKAHRVLKGLPLILLSKGERETYNTPDTLIYVNIPFKEKFFIKSVEDLIKRFRISRRIEQIKWQIISGTGKKVLIIDQSRNFSAGNIKSLTDHGFEVFVVDSEENILQRVGEYNPDIILIDEDTGEIDFVSICRLMNINRALKVIPRILVAKDKEASEIFHSQDLISGLVIKPFNSKQLIMGINDVLSMH